MQMSWRDGKPGPRVLKNDHALRMVRAVLTTLFGDTGLPEPFYDAVHMFRVGNDVLVMP